MTALSYLRAQREIATAALAAYERVDLIEKNADIKRMREAEAIRLRANIVELDRHIAVVEMLENHA